MPINVSFTIVDCSGEDTQNPCTELLAHTQDSKGWCTPRNSAYPHHLTLLLDCPARLHQIQLLSHEYKIAGKVEIQVAPPPPNNTTDPAADSQMEFSRLGFLAFDPNDRTQFSARELKSVTLPDVEAAAVRIIIHRCHKNDLNIYNQACLIMLNLVGEPIVVPESIIMSPTNTNKAAIIVPTTAIAANHNTSTTVAAVEEDRVDAVTAQRISELQAQKAAAVAIEDYDEAKRLKLAIERLRTAGEKMAALEKRKKAAVEVEDYDTAKSIKVELDRMRQRAYAAIMRGESSFIESPIATIDNNRRQIDQAAAVAAAAGVLSPQNNKSSAERVLSPVQQQHSEENFNSPVQPAIINNQINSAAKPSSSSLSDWQSYDERPARAKGAYDLDSIENSDASTPPPGIEPVLRRIDANAGGGGRFAAQMMTMDTASTADIATTNTSNDNFTIPAAVGNTNAIRNQPPTNGEGGPPPPPGFQSDLPYPELLSPDDAKEAAQIQSLVGEFLTRCLYSKIWRLREAAISHLAGMLLATAAAAPQKEKDEFEQAFASSLENNGDNVRVLCSIVSQGVKARIPAVVSASLSLLKSLVSAAGPGKLPLRDLHASLAELLPSVAEKTTDAVPRARDQAIEALVAIAKVKESNLGQLSGIFLRQIKKGESPKATLGRLQLVSALLPVIGVGSSPEGGFSVEAVVHFAAPALTSAAVEVRSAASEVVVKVGKSPGVGAAAVLALLPADLNPKLRQQLESDLTGQPMTITGKKKEPSSSRPVTTTQSNNKHESRRPSSATAAPSQPAAAGQRSRTTSTTADPPPQQQQQQSRRPSSNATTTQPPPSSYNPSAYNNYAPPPPPPPQQQQPIEVQPSYTPSVAATDYSIVDEDPSIYEQELKRRMASLGPQHPAVADAASNLAIIYNQRGESGRALPLYQQALQIWEAVHGPNHPDVAHCLTDIAVILLEAGHDNEGKQLLKRALDIQIGVLGPNHPDVLAIKDVLEEEY